MAVSLALSTIAHIIRWVVTIKYELVAEEGESLAGDKTQYLYVLTCFA